MSRDARRLMMPWAAPGDLYSTPRRVVLKLALGEAPESIPASMDVRVGAADAAAGVDGGAIDRILSRFSGRFRISRVHVAAGSMSQPGSRHLGYDDMEQALGLARTFRVETERDCCIDDLIDALRQIDRVEQASPHYLCTVPFGPLDTLPADFTEAWAAREQISVPEAMAYEPGDPAVITAIVDTGVCSDHPELHGRVRPGLDTVQLGTSDLAVGLKLLGDLSGIDREPDDEVGHGTACATIVGGSGERIPPGLAGDGGLLPVRVLGAARVTGKQQPVGIGAIADIDFGLKFAIDAGATVVGMSFGTPESSLDEDDPRPHQDVIQYGLARGCVLVAASGNSGKEERFLPAGHEGVIGVASVDAEGKPSAFSTRGEHVALSAPGERVLSAGLGVGYQLVTGTSFAAPFVAGAASLLVSRSRRRSHPVDSRKVAKILRESVRSWPEGHGEGCGAGILDVHAALRQLDREIDGVDRGQDMQGNTIQPTEERA